MSSPTKELLRADVRRVLEGELGCSPERIVDAARLVEDLGCDSLDLVELVIELEGRFDIDITDDEGDALRTVGDVHALVARKVGHA